MQAAARSTHEMSTSLGFRSQAGHCVCMVTMSNPVTHLSFAATLAHYAPSKMGVRMAFGSLAEYVRSAVAGVVSLDD